MRFLAITVVAIAAFGTCQTVFAQDSGQAGQAKVLQIATMETPPRIDGNIGHTDFSAIATSEDLEIADDGRVKTANYGTLRLQQGVTFFTRFSWVF